MRRWKVVSYPIFHDSLSCMSISIRGDGICNHSFNDHNLHLIFFDYITLEKYAGGTDVSRCNVVVHCYCREVYETVGLKSIRVYLATGKGSKTLYALAHHKLA